MEVGVWEARVVRCPSSHSCCYSSYTVTMMDVSTVEETGQGKDA